MELSSNSIDILASRLVSEDERRARSSDLGGSATVVLRRLKSLCWTDAVRSLFNASTCAMWHCHNHDGDQLRGGTISATAPPRGSDRNGLA
ncbi:hypothetical protein HZ326_29488 [Fusarium oxysporum f. sp. albedinis]|nr:hypothetical protein HZ326_29488 [Fusarium oxysporum f. sp. albedinis]